MTDSSCTEILVSSVPGGLASSLGLVWALKTVASFSPQTAIKIEIPAFREKQIHKDTKLQSYPI